MIFNIFCRACELVSHLLSDLISTTNSYQQVQEKEARLSTDLALAQAQLFPLRRDNARLTKENHVLHNESVQLSTDISNTIEDYTRKAQKQQEEIQDLAFLCEAQNEQIKTKSEAFEKIRAVRDLHLFLFVDFKPFIW